MGIHFYIFSGRNILSYEHSLSCSCMTMDIMNSGLLHVWHSFGYTWRAFGNFIDFRVFEVFWTRFFFQSFAYECIAFAHWKAPEEGTGISLNPEGGTGIPLRSSAGRKGIPLSAAGGKAFHSKRQQQGRAPP